MRVHCRRDFMCAGVLVYLYVRLGCTRVCANSKRKEKKSDTQSTKGVKINALFTFT